MIVQPSNLVDEVGIVTVEIQILNSKIKLSVSLQHKAKFQRQRIVKEKIKDLSSRSRRSNRSKI